MTELCKPFGEVETLSMKKDATGQTQTGIIVFKTADEANNAMQGLNGLLLGGLSINITMDKGAGGPTGNEGEDSKLDDIGKKKKNGWVCIQRESCGDGDDDDEEE